MTMIHPSGVDARWYGFQASAGAEFSDDRTHRFLLWRIWSPEPGRLLGFVMLNPSTADAVKDDATTTRNMARARLLGYAGIVQTNLYSFRTPSPAKLKSEGYPGPAREETVNGEALARMMEPCRDVVFAWGAHARIEDAGRFIILANCRWRKPDTRFLHLGRLKNGSPRHPLMVSYNTPLQEWK